MPTGKLSKTTKRNGEKKQPLPEEAKKNLGKFFGIQPSEIGGPEFQKKVRAEWD